MEATVGIERDNAIIRDFIRGVSAQVLAKRHAISTARVYKIVKDAGIERDLGKKRRDAVREDVVRMYRDEGASIAHICETLNVTYPVVRKVLEEEELVIEGEKLPSRKPSPLNERQRLDMALAYLCGASTVQLGKDYGVTQKTAWKTVNGFRVNGMRGVVDIARAEEIAKRWAGKDATWLYIARREFLPEAAVRVIMESRGGI